MKRVFAKLKRPKADDGTRRKYVYDARAYQNGSSTYAFTENGHTFSYTYRTEFVYDALGRVVTTIHPPTVVQEGGTNPVPTYSHTGYDGLGRKVWESNVTTEPVAASVPDGEVKEFEYDAAGRLKAVILPPVADPDNNNTMTYPRTKYGYNAQGQLLAIYDKIRQFANGSIDESVMRTTAFTYNELGQQTSRTMPDMRTESKHYDTLGRLDYEVDFKGQVTGYTYDAQGRLEEKAYYLTLTAYQQNAPAETVQYLYDNLGRLYQTIDLRGTTTHHYDNEGRLTQLDSPEGTLHYEYHPITGHKIRTWTESGEVDTLYGYDDLGRLRTVEDDLQAVVTTYGYDPAGNRQTVQLPNGITGTHVYDQVNRLMSLTQGTQASFAYTVHADGMRATAVETLAPENEARTLTYTYDNLNRLTGENAAKAGGQGYAAAYVYDLAGNRLERRVTVTNASGTQRLKTVYGYNAQNDRLMTESYQTFTAWRQVPGMPVYAGLDGGELAYKTAGGQRLTQWTAYLMGLPSRLSRPLAWGAWGLFALVMLLPVLWQVVRKIQFSRGGAEPPSKEKQPLRPVYSLFTRTLAVALAFTFILGPQQFQQLAQADISFSQLQTADWGTAGESIAYAYDDNGAMTSKTVTGGSDPHTMAYEYNLRGRLKKVTRTAGASVATTEYAYNDQGVRVSKHYTAAGTNETTVYLVDADNPTGYAQTLVEKVYNTAGSTPVLVSTMAYTIGDDIIAQTLNPLGSPATDYLLYDGHGSTRQLADEAGAISESHSYDAYGVRLGHTTQPEPATSLQYCGEHYDSDAKMYNLRARWYDQSVGRFTQMDPFGGNNADPQSLHKYLYAKANPVNEIDPTGMLSLGELATSFGIVAILGRMTVGAVLGVADAHFRGYSYGRGAVGGAIFGIFGPLIPLGLGLFLGGLGVIEALAAGEYDSALFRAATLGFGYALQARGFSSLRDFKGFFGRAGQGRAWHHIVEQTPGNIAKFGAEPIHNPNNIAPLPHGAGSVHAKISGFYSSKQTYITGKGYSTIRQWLATKSYAEQYRFGLESMARFGGGSVPMNVCSTLTSWAWPAALEPFKENVTSEEDDD